VPTNTIFNSQYGTAIITTSVPNSSLSLNNTTGSQIVLLLASIINTQNAINSYIYIEQLN